MATESSNKDSKGNGSDSEAILEDMKQLDLEKKSLDEIDDPKPTSNANQEANPDLDPSKPQEPESVANVVLKPTVIEDFLRNFLISNEMHESLGVFQREWYNKLQRDDELTAIAKIPDIYIQREKLEASVKHLRGNLERMESVTSKVKSTWDALRKERDFHRMHHRRVLQEKNELIKQLKRLKKYCDSYEPTIASLKSKYENAKKEKMLFRIDRDKMAVKLDAMEEQIRGLQQNYMEQKESRQSAASNSKSKASTSSLSSKQSNAMKRSSSRETAATSNSQQTQSSTASFPSCSASNPYLERDFEVDVVCVEKFSLQKTLSVHKHAVSKMALHPSKDIVATASDDMTWKLWNLPSGELIMSGEGHKDWISAVSFSPAGSHLATASGDCTVKIWDFARSQCVATLSDHTSVVWGVSYHLECANFVVSCSMDHTCKLWDIEAAKCRQTYRGHVDSVNCVAFQPYSNHMVSGSGDKTISFWDLRSALCIQTFYGHHNSVNNVAFNRKCDEIISCDADGIVKIWDIRMIREKKQINTGKFVHPSSHVIFDESGKRAVVACDDALIKVYDTESGEHIESLAGHEDGVNCVMFSHQNKMLLSCSSDCTLRLWQ